MIYYSVENHRQNFSKRCKDEMSHIRIRRQNDILWLVLDRPPLNILSIEMLDQLTRALRDAAKQKPRLIVLMGAGERAFSAGVDVKDHLDGQIGRASCRERV